MLSIARVGLSMGTIVKMDRLKVSHWKCPLQKRKWPCPFNMFKDVQKILMCILGMINKDLNLNLKIQACYNFRFYEFLYTFVC